MFRIAMCNVPNDLSPAYQNSRNSTARLSRWSHSSDVFDFAVVTPEKFHFLANPKCYKGLTGNRSRQVADVYRLQPQSIRHLKFRDARGGAQAGKLLPVPAADY